MKKRRSLVPRKTGMVLVIVPGTLVLLSLLAVAFFLSVNKELSAGIVLLIVFMTFLFPQLTVRLSKTGQKLPFMTRMLIGTREFLEPV